MNNRDKNTLSVFLTIDKQVYTDLLMLLFDRLSLQLEFNLKIQKASIQLVHELPFAVIGFRKAKDYLFVEFYNNYITDNNRIVRINDNDNLMIIHTIHISSNSDIDDNMIKWIEKSYDLTKK